MYGDWKKCKFPISEFPEAFNYYTKTHFVIRVNIVFWSGVLTVSQL